MISTDHKSTDNDSIMSHPLVLTFRKDAAGQGLHIVELIPGYAFIDGGGSGSKSYIGSTNRICQMLNGNVSVVSRTPRKA